MTAGETYRFAGFEADTASRELRRDGALVEMEPKAFDLLVYLLRHRDRAVDKQELQDRIWAGTVVTEAALTRCVSKARRALGDDARPGDVIRTVHGHGYRFVAALDERAAKPTPLDAADKPTLAVLPFENLSGDPAQQYFSDGITDDIITALSRFHTVLLVISRHSSFSYRGRAITSQQVGTELGVTYLVDGSVQRAGNRVRVNVRLVEAGTGKHLWGERYERELEDIFAVQDELTGTIVATLGGRVAADEWRRVKASPGRVDARCYDLVLQGQALHFQVLKAANDRARDVLRQALTLDPDNARAHALMGAVELVHFTMGWSADPTGDLNSAREHGLRAVQIDDTDSQAHAHLGETLLNCGQLDDARIQYEQAIALNPADIISRALYSLYFCQIGEAERSIEQLDLVQRLDPFELSWIPWFRGESCYLLGRYQDAVDSLVRVSEPINDVRRWLAACYAQLGRDHEARALLQAYLDTAAVEMPHFPGRTFSDWESLLRDEYAHPPYEQRIVDGLRKAWPPG